MQAVLGADGLFEGLSEGNIWIDHTTSSYEQTIELTGEAAKRGFRPVECPITGGSSLNSKNLWQKSFVFQSIYKNIDRDV